METNETKPAETIVAPALPDGIKAIVRLERDVLACVDAESRRYALANVLLEPGVGDIGPRLVACNGRIMAVRETEGIANEGGLVPPGAFGKRPKILERRVGELNGAWRSGVQGRHCSTLAVPQDGCETHAVPEGRFPNWRDVLPQIDAAQAVAVCIDATLLANLATALGSKCITLIFEPENGVVNRAIGVVPSNGTEAALGVIMPLCRERSRTGDDIQSSATDVARYAELRERLTAKLIDLGDAE